MEAFTEITSKLEGGMIVCTLTPLERRFPDNVKALGVFVFTVATDQKEMGDVV